MPTQSLYEKVKAYDACCKTHGVMFCSDQRIEYQIESARNISKLSGDEELVRAYLVNHLINDLGYSVDSIEFERTYDIGRPKCNKPRIDVIVKERNGEDIFLYMELKSPESYENDDHDEIIEKQLYNLSSQEIGSGRKVKYLVLYTIEIDNDKVKDRCKVIDYEKYKSFNEWKEERNVADALPSHYGKTLKIPYVKNSAHDLKNEFSIEQINSLRRNLHNVLWGGGGTDYNVVFSSLTNLILAKIQDENEKEDGNRYDFQCLTFENDEESFETNEMLFERINALYRRALKERLNVSDETKLRQSFVVDLNNFPLSKLKYAVQQLEGLSFVDGKNSINGKDILGDFFEGIITDGFKQSKGQFFTHGNIVQFMLWGLQVDNLVINRIVHDKEIPYMIDPSAGSGTFLIEYMKFVTKVAKYRNQNKSKMPYNSLLGTSRDVRDKIETAWFYPDYRENRWAKDYIYGAEINFNLGLATKVNMILHGDGSTNIFVTDGLLPFSKYEKSTAPNALNQHSVSPLYGNKEINGQFDLILTNPPFSVDLDNDTKKSVKKEFLFGDKKNSENLFIERWFQLLREGGRFAAVLPESVFDTSDNKYIRLFIYKYFKVKAVVSLPSLAFEPYTPTKTSILFAQKKTELELKQWNELWEKYSSEWSGLKTRCSNIRSVVLGEKKVSSLPTLKGLSEKDYCTLLKRLLKDYLKKDDEEMSSFDIIRVYGNKIEELCKIDKEMKDVFGFVDVWWVFSEVAKNVDYPVFMAEAENIGYKRTKRGEQLRSNDLYRTNHLGDVVVDDGKKESILDYMRDIKWD